MLIPTATLKAVSLFAGKKDVRNYLNGVHFTRNAAGLLLVVGTNGAAVGLAACGPVEPFEPFTVPVDTISIVLKAYGKLASLDVTAAALEGIPFMPLEGKYPDFAQVVPSTVSGTSAHFNPELVELFYKASKALGTRTGQIHIHQNGSDGAAVTVPYIESFIGVLMPLRDLGKNYVEPDLAAMRSRLL